MYHAYNHKVGIQFVNHKYDCMITDRIGQDNMKSCYQLIKTMTNLRKKPDIDYIFPLKKINSAKCETTVHKNDAFFPLTQA